MKNRQSKDMVLKKVFGKNDYFASVFNNFLFDGENIINPDSLKDSNPEYIMNNDGELNKRQRDLIKNAVYKVDSNISYLLLGIENQTTIDKNMVFRIMQYDANSYMRQVDIEKENKDDKIKIGYIPVITLVIYYGKRKWNAPIDLYSMLNINDKIKCFVNNYRINLLCPLELSDNEINKYIKNIKFLFTYLKYSDRKEEMIERIVYNTEYERIDNDIVDAVNILTDSNIEYSIDEEEVDMCKALKDLKKEGRQEGIQEEHARMCKALKDLKEEGRQEGIQEECARMCKELEDLREEGRQEGKAEGIKEVEEKYIKSMYDNGFDANTIAKALGLDLNYIKMVLCK